ncbi:hypothetical protein VTN77DRAFT_68 [Rasamsonia byssochlamydoides]|uniref:uncharacterized protein n=1 Tax=Rasamsonia byssochlamydoides TaxID=89139 RepID=UPI0037444B0A
MGNRLLGALSSIVAFTYGLFNIFLYTATAVRAGTFFKRPTEKENLELRLARDRFWNLSKQWAGCFSHQFLTLRDGFKFHYVTNDVLSNRTATSRPERPLVILIHGFPDSWALWRHIIGSTWLRESSSLVAVDLPGYGGSDRLEKYTATEVLEKLTEFVVAVRERYEIDSQKSEKATGRVIIVGHDWGCVLAMRLAADAPQLADRFILSNGPLPGLVSSNIRRLVSSAVKMFKIFLHSPLQSRLMLTKAFQTLKPALRQLALSGYIFVMQLPLPLVRYLGSGGNYSFLKATHKIAHGELGDYTVLDAAESMASSLGPSAEECETENSDHDRYPESVIKQRGSGNFVNMASYYRHGTAVASWSKSVESIATLHGLSRGSDVRRMSSRAAVFDDGPKGSLKANATILWALQDVALERQLCLDGIGDYLVHNSQVITLPRSGHFTPIEQESRVALEKAIEWAVGGEKEDIGSIIRTSYSGAAVTLRT